MLGYYSHETQQKKPADVVEASSLFIITRPILFTFEIGDYFATKGQGNVEQQKFDVAMYCETVWGCTM